MPECVTSPVKPRYSRERNLTADISQLFVSGPRFFWRRRFELGGFSLVHAPTPTLFDGSDVFNDSLDELGIQFSLRIS